MKKLLFVALLGSAMLMSCGGASTKTVGSVNDSIAVVDSTVADSVLVDSLINDSI